jgi:hypothetical protein
VNGVETAAIPISGSRAPTRTSTSTERACATRRQEWRNPADLATLIAMADTDEVVRLRLLRAIRDLRV